jgi:hypothetical protein
MLDQWPEILARPDNDDLFIGYISLRWEKPLLEARAIKEMATKSFGTIPGF